MLFKVFSYLVVFPGQAVYADLPSANATYASIKNWRTCPWPILNFPQTSALLRLKETTPFAPNKTEKTSTHPAEIVVTFFQLLCSLNSSQDR